VSRIDKTILRGDFVLVDVMARIDCMLGFRKSFVGSLPALIKGESTMIVGVHLVNHRKDPKEDTSYP
jgi:hypothetical protein